MRVVVAAKIELRGLEVQEPADRPGGELGHRADPAQRARVDAEPHQLGDVRAETGPNLFHAGREHRRERGERGAGLPRQDDVRRLDVQHAGGDAADLDRDRRLAENPTRRRDEVGVRADVTDDLDRAGPHRAPHHALIEREPVAHLLVAPLGDEPEPIVLDGVHAGEHAAPEAVDESLERDVDRVAALTACERLLGGTTRAAERPAVDPLRGATRKRLRVSAATRSRSGVAVSSVADGTQTLGGLRGDRGRLVERLEEEIEHVRVELGAATVAHQLERLARRHRSPVHAVGRDRVVHVGDRRDPPLERNRLTGETARIPLAVEPLVVRPRDRRRDIQELRRRSGHQLVPDLGVPLHRAPLVRGQRARP